MEAADIARKLSGDGRILEVGTGVGRLYRIWDEGGTRLVKVYSTTAAERREQQALENLTGLPGLPTVLSRGEDGGYPWAVFKDPGKWNLASLPESAGLGRKAGEILRALHSRVSDHFSNVSHGIDQEWINGDFPATFKRLARYRGKLHIPSEIVESAADIAPPTVSSGVVVHTDPNPEQFYVDDDENMTLFHWDWSTLGAPEWDYSKLLWLTGLKAGLDAATGVAGGYGSDMTDDELQRWAVYHSGMMLVSAVEVSDQQLRGVDWLVEELTRAVAAAGLIG